MQPHLIPLMARMEAFVTRTAVISVEGRFTFAELLDRSRRVAGVLLDGRRDLGEARVAFLVPPGIDYVAVKMGIWLAGGVSVPLCTQHPEPELDYVLGDAKASMVVVHPQYADRLGALAQRRGLPLLLTPAFQLAAAAASLPEVAADRRAMILYTSGTTSKPKGVVSSHDMLAAQITSLVQAWQWTADDHILHVLPLHHLHGILNVLCCSLWSGATCQMLPRFDAAEVWARLMDDETLTLFMAVPTIYARLTAAWESADAAKQQVMSDACRRLRLMVSGSAALPVPTLDRWHNISGHTLLERYGMTEIGMALSNPLHGQRRPGCVGSPLPGVEVRLVNEQQQMVAEGDPGEIQVSGPNVFREYWQRPEATAKSFTADGWFKTGDVAVRVEGVYRILGRESVDIIKTGGYKVSALEIEEVLRTHPSINEVAVVGLEDAEWGQRVAALAVLQPRATLDLESLRTWAKQRLAVYKVPTRLLVVADLPRNPMGKVVKPELVRLFEQQQVTS